jgi:hypothetical protein
MNRSLAAILALSLLSSGVSPSPAFASGDHHPGSVLRLRGGYAFPDPDLDPGPGWSAGGAVGVVLNRSVLLSLSYDHIDLDKPDNNLSRRAIDPVTVEVELLVFPLQGITPRLAAGAGPYFHDQSRFVYPYYGASPQRVHSLEASFGMHFGGGFSIPITNRTMVDLDFRYHQTVGREQALVVSTAGVGLRFLFPGGPADPTDYVQAKESPLAYAENP